MKLLPRWLPVLAVVAGGLLSGRPAFGTAAAAVAPTIKDEAKLFSEDARDKANQKLRQIYRDYHKDLLIETFPEVPKDLQKDLADKGKDKFFADWALHKAREADVNGVYVLICKHPGHVQVEVGNETRKKAFTLDNRSKLIKTLVENFRDKKYDQGLTEGVDYVASTLRENLGPPGEHHRRTDAQADFGGGGRQARGEPVGDGHQGGSFWSRPMGWVCIGFLVLVGLWLVIGLMRAFTGAGGGSGPGGGYGGGGGGFMSSLFGGLFGLRRECGSMTPSSVVIRTEALAADRPMATLAAAAGLSRAIPTTPAAAATSTAAVVAVGVGTSEEAVAILAEVTLGAAVAISVAAVISAGAAAISEPPARS